MARVVAVGGDTDLSSQSLRVRVDASGRADRYAAGQQISVAAAARTAGHLERAIVRLLPAGSAHVLYVASRHRKTRGDLRVRAVPVQLLGQDESEASSAVRAVSPDTAPLAAGMQVVVRGTALLKSMLPLQ
jgi:hypothetical protein